MSGPKTSGGYFIGMDEAGYGPNLGPLLVAATKWSTPGPPADCDFYALLAEVVSPVASSKSDKMQIADSKAVNVGKRGFENLETAAMVLMNCAGIKTDSFHRIWGVLNGGSLPENVPPWYGDDLSLPVTASAGHVLALSERLSHCLRVRGVELCEIAVDLVVEERFNELTTACDNKGLALSRIAFELLKKIWDPDDPKPTVFVGDKHGGRNRYDELIADVIDGQMIFRGEEGRDFSRYRVGNTELRFQTKGERHFPVAAASIIAKYLRELSMNLINDFWRRHAPDLKPTRGYPEDARRFRQVIEPHCRELGVRERHYWRLR